MRTIRRISKACALAAGLLLVANTSSISIARADHSGHGRGSGHGWDGHRGSYGSGHVRGGGFSGTRYRYDRGGYSVRRYRSAHADRGYYPVRRYVTTRYRYPVHYYRPAHFYYSSFPRVAFSIGISNFPSAGYYYYDPYCDESFASLDLYLGHFHHHHHPRVIEVIAIDGGYPISSYCWDDGDWVPY